MKLTKEQIESIRDTASGRGLDNSGRMTLPVSVVRGLCRLALLGLEHDRIVAERDARPDISADEAAAFICWYEGGVAHITTLIGELRAHAVRAAKP